MKHDCISFVDAWMTAYENNGNQTTVANSLGCSAANVSIRAKRLRQLGVELPELNSVKTSKIDVAHLNNILKSRMIS